MRKRKKKTSKIQAQNPSNHSKCILATAGGGKSAEKHPLRSHIAGRGKGRSNPHNSAESPAIRASNSAAEGDAVLHHLMAEKHPREVACMQQLLQQEQQDPVLYTVDHHTSRVGVILDYSTSSNITKGSIQHAESADPNPWNNCGPGEDACLLPAREASHEEPGSAIYNAHQAPGEQATVHLLGAEQSDVATAPEAPAMGASSDGCYGEVTVGSRCVTTDDLGNGAAGSVATERFHLVPNAERAGSLQSGSTAGYSAIESTCMDSETSRPIAYGSMEVDHDPAAYGGEFISSLAQLQHAVDPVAQQAEDVCSRDSCTSTGDHTSERCYVSYGSESQDSLDEQPLLADVKGLSMLIGPIESLKGFGVAHNTDAAATQDRESSMHTHVDTTENFALDASTDEASGVAETAEASDLLKHHGVVSLMEWDLHTIQHPQQLQAIQQKQPPLPQSPLAPSLQPHRQQQPDTGTGTPYVDFTAQPLLRSSPITTRSGGLHASTENSKQGQKMAPSPFQSALLSRVIQPPLNSFGEILEDDSEAELGENVPEEEMATLEEGLMALRLFFGSCRDIKPPEAPNRDHQSDFISMHAHGASSGDACQDDPPHSGSGEVSLAEHSNQDMSEADADHEHAYTLRSLPETWEGNVEPGSEITTPQAQSLSLDVAGASAAAGYSIALCEARHPPTTSDFSFPCVVATQQQHTVHMHHACSHVNLQSGDSGGAVQIDSSVGHGRSTGTTEASCHQQFCSGAENGADAANPSLATGMSHQLAPSTTVSGSLGTFTYVPSPEIEVRCHVSKDSRRIDECHSRMAGIKSQIEALVHSYSQLKSEMRVLEQGVDLV